MSPHLTHIAAQQRIADLHRAAERDRRFRRAERRSLIRPRVALALLVGLLACSSDAAAQAGPLGDQPTLLVPIRQQAPFCNDATNRCAPPDTADWLGAPRHSARAWGDILDREVNAFYGATATA